jgi:hypothetical protein
MATATAFEIVAGQERARAQQEMFGIISGFLLAAAGLKLRKIYPDRFARERYRSDRRRLDRQRWLGIVGACGPG